MSGKRATLVTINSLTALSKVSLNSIKTLPLAKNLSTATERSDFQNPNVINGENHIDYQHNPSEFYSDNRNNAQGRAYSGINREFEQNPDGLYRRNLVGIEQNPRNDFHQHPVGQSGNFYNGYSKESSSNKSQQNPVGQNGYYSTGYMNQGTGNDFQNQCGNNREGIVEGQQNLSGVYAESGLESQGNAPGHFGQSSSGYNPQKIVTSQRNPSDNHVGNHGMSQQNAKNNSYTGSIGNFQNVPINNYEGSYGNSNNLGDNNYAGSGRTYQHSPSGYMQNPSGNYQASVGHYQEISNEFHNRIVGQVSRNSQPDGKSIEGGESNLLRGTIEEFDDFCKKGKLKEALEVLGLLEQQHIPINLPQYLMLMKACGEAQALQEAKSVHEHLMRSVFHLEVSTYNKILEMYVKCGSMPDANVVFHKMPQRNLTSWDTMISWLAKNGLGEDAIELFTRFKESGLKPDGKMFFGVFSACSVLGDIDEGLLHFESMSKNYGIDSSMEHYVSIVDMLGSTGYLDEALEFIEKMPMEPNAVVWETLMNHCRVHGNKELGDRCVEFIELPEPSLLNEQSKTGLIPEKASDRSKEREKKNLSGQNLLEVRSRVHEYRAGDTSHPDNDKIYALLRGMKQQMKEAGYVPETKFVLHDIDQEGKEEALLAHSERLAVAQGLISSPARSPIRIIKNLRVCGDCHTALKIISKLVGRKLIIRDAKRFHHFEDGLCSCRDYW